MSSIKKNSAVPLSIVRKSQGRTCVDYMPASGKIMVLTAGNREVPDAQVR
jgi:hypothetical protein